jgi:hypothetical protein
MKIFLVGILCAMSILSNAQERVKLYAFYTPSHKILVDQWFLPSVQDDYEMVIEFHEQECESGNFMDVGWLDAMHRKVDLIIRAIEENWGKIFIHSDIDIQFFKPTKAMIMALMQKKDLVIQRDSPQGGICAGFFACRGNDRTLKLWKDIKKRMLETMQSGKPEHDQKALSYFLKLKPCPVVWDFLPVEFFNAGTLTGKGWMPGRILPIPHNIVLHHANWTVGVANKIAQLKYVRDEVNKRN